RNTIGFGWHPTSGRMFGMDHGIDWLGDDDQKEEFNEILRGRRYGWPYIYADGKENPHKEPAPPFSMDGWRAQSVNPLLLYTAHSAPMGMTYYTGSMFPPEYRNDEIRAMRGSWNRVPASGYELVRVRYDAAGNPTGIDPLVTGFVQPGDAAASPPAANHVEMQMARLCGVTQASDGAVLFSDDTNNVIYRLSYGGEMPPASLEDQEGLTLERAGDVPPLTVSSEAFPNDATIPLKHSAYGEDRSPMLMWSAPPSGTKSFAIVMEDPDALSPKPTIHWLAADVSPVLTRLPEGVTNTPRPGRRPRASGGAGTSGTLGYFGPKPPATDPAHRYHFEVYALDTKLD
ncbi:YbhB/YbcL family Raf kinase inhibitor-like protein, partial [bacterium]